MKLFKELKWEVFHWRFFLIPLSVPMITKNQLTFRMVLIFGVRVGYWTVG